MSAPSQASPPKDCCRKSGCRSSAGADVKAGAAREGAAAEPGQELEDDECREGADWDVQGQRVGAAEKGEGGVEHGKVYRNGRWGFGAAGSRRANSMRPIRRMRRMWWGTASGVLAGG